MRLFRRHLQPGLGRINGAHNRRLILECVLHHLGGRQNTQSRGEDLERLVQLLVLHAQRAADGAVLGIQGQQSAGALDQRVKLSRVRCACGDLLLHIGYRILHRRGLLRHGLELLGVLLALEFHLLELLLDLSELCLQRLEIRIVAHVAIEPLRLGLGLLELRGDAVDLFHLGSSGFSVAFRAAECVKLLGEVGQLGAETAERALLLLSVLDVVLDLLAELLHRAAVGLDLLLALGHGLVVVAF